MTVHHIVAKAKRSGLLVPQPCEDCSRHGGGVTREPVVAHHDDYAQPLDVRWLCHMHHHWWHEKNEALNRPLMLKVAA